MFTFTSTNSAVFKYFHRTADGDAAKCVFCKKLLLCKGSSSKGLWTHLKSMHNEKYVKFKKKLEAIKANAVKVPPKKLAQTVVDQKRVYKYLQTVKSWEELNKLRFKHSCRFIGHFKRRQNNFKSIIIPCGWRITGKQCEFVLKAMRLESGTIHVYTFSKHNHPLESNEKRLIHVQPKELMADANPPATLRTLDDLEWTFLQTFPDYEQMHKFRHENQCQSRSYEAMWQRIRYSCIRRRSADLCKFKLMAMRTPKLAYHVYKHGEHNHAASTPKNFTKGRKPPAAASEDPPAAVEDLPAIAEDLLAAAEDPPAIIRTSDTIEWKFLQTFPDYETMDEFRCENLCSSKPLDTTETGQIRYSCNRRFSTNRCQFKLLAMETTNKKGYHVYQHGEHKHPVIKRETEKWQQSTSKSQGQQQYIEKQIKMENLNEDEGDDDEDDEDDNEDEDANGEEDDDNDEDDNSDKNEDDEEDKDGDDNDEDDDDSDDSVDDPDYKMAAKRIVPRGKGIATRRSGRGIQNGAGQ